MFQQYQGARTQKPGTQEITPNIATVSFTDDGETERIQNQLGLQAAFGLTPKADLRAEFGLLVNPGESGFGWSLGLGLSFGIDK